ncbi:cytochrome c oxidase assembly factor 1 homolog isoform e [Homo sapiens]|uniref:cytochrome c oxidase assembly factor 1 homolog isoform e n=1 Tax=Homo sapiens TaxID=9606 RepID=UPI00114D3E94|nr:cytochrome c oxidase assembly factor 1 homolog isoform e [Homo sapiens]
MQEAGGQCLWEQGSFSTVCSMPGALPLCITSFKVKFHSRALYYKLAVEQLQSHPEAQEALGPPLNIHYLKLIDRENFVDIVDAKLKIPVSGSKSEGLLYVHSSRGGPFQRWHLDEVFLELKDGQQIPVFKLSGENGDEVKKE